MKLCLLTTNEKSSKKEEAFVFTVNTKASVSYSSTLATIHSTHFCSLCIAAKNPPPKRYHLIIAEKELENGKLHVDVCIMYSLRLCIEVIIAFIFISAIIHMYQILLQKVKSEQFQEYQEDKVISYGPVFFSDGVINVTIDPTTVPGWEILFRGIYSETVSHIKECAILKSFNYYTMIV